MFEKWVDVGTALETGFHAAGQPLQAGANPVYMGLSLTASHWSGVSKIEERLLTEGM